MVYTLSCLYSLCWQDRGPSWAGATLSLLSLMATPPLLFHISTLLDRSKALNSVVLKVQARDHGGSAMFMRSTPGCGTLRGPSLELVDFWSPKQKGSVDSPELKRPGALGGPSRPESVQLKRYDMHIPGIFLSCITAH